MTTRERKTKVFANYPVLSDMVKKVSEGIRQQASGISGWIPIINKRIGYSRKVKRSKVNMLWKNRLFWFGVVYPQKKNCKCIIFYDGNWGSATPNYKGIYPLPIIEEAVSFFLVDSETEFHHGFSRPSGMPFLFVSFYPHTSGPIIPRISSSFYFGI